MKYDNNITKGEWLFWTIFTVIITIISIFIYWMVDGIKWHNIAEVAFIIYLIGYAGWKTAFHSFVSIALICIVIYLFILAMENPEYKSGISALNNNDYKTAITKLEQVIADDPGHYNAFHALCEAKTKVGHLKEALLDCNRAINLNYPIKNESYANRARVYEKLGKHEKAIKDFTVSLKHFKSWYVLYERCILFNRVKRYDNAIKDCTTAHKLNNDFYHLWWPLGNAFYQNKEYKKAFQAYKNYQQKAEKTPEFMQQRMAEISEF